MTRISFYYLKLVVHVILNGQNDMKQGFSIQIRIYDYETVWQTIGQTSNILQPLLM